MRTKFAHDPRPEALGAAPGSGPLADLAGKLLRCAREQVTEPGDDGSNVLMDLESDGIRCLVVRTAVDAPQTPLLSPREQEIARMVAGGLPNKTIAAVLEISSWTVGTYLRRMFAKLGVSSRAAMVAKVMQTPHSLRSHSRT
jgi:DNA-binding CsgD family transcriptional regulator